MSFLDILKELVDGVKGGVAATLMGMDGLPIQLYAGAAGYDIETLAVEYGKVIDEIKNASTLLNLGTVEEVTVATGGTDVLLRMVTPEYYIAFIIGHGTNAGKAKYLLRRAAVRAAKELSA